MFLFIYICVCVYHHHHLVVPSAQISLTLSCHLYLSFIAFSRSSGLHPISSLSCYMYICVDLYIFVQPCEGVHRSTSLLLQQCPVYIYTYKCVHVCIYKCVCVYISVYVYMCVYKCVCVCVYKYVYLCVCVYMCIYIYIYVCVYKRLEFLAFQIVLNIPLCCGTEYKPPRIINQPSFMSRV